VARIAGVDLPRDKRLDISLTYIYGIGTSGAQAIVAGSGVEGATKVRVTGRAFPNIVVLHPNDWEEVRLTRTTDGIYILGNPSDEGPERIWSMRAIQSDNQTQNTAVVGDFANYAQIRVRRGVEVEKTNSHSTFFIEGKQAVRASVRMCTVWRRAAAFCTVTGI
jgi:HK97 family phage major capsid protein